MSSMKIQEGEVLTTPSKRDNEVFQSRFFHS
jgi:hypothetical protein